MRRRGRDLHEGDVVLHARRRWVVLPPIPNDPTRFLGEHEVDPRTNEDTGEVSRLLPIDPDADYEVDEPFSRPVVDVPPLDDPEGGLGA